MSYGLLALAFVDFALLVWAVRECLRAPNNTAMILQTVLLALLWFDAGTVAIGGALGAGPLLETMSRIRYTWFYLTMPLLLVGAPVLARQAGFALMQSRWPAVVLAIVGLVFALRDAPMAWTADYHTACFGETVRYVFKVPVGQACIAGEEGIGGGGFTPSIPLVFLAVTSIGLALMIRRRWPWLGLAALLFMATTAIPPQIAGPYLTYPADTLMTAAFLFAARRFPPPMLPGRREKRAE